MERSTYSLTYKGSISDAINESRNQKKLFVVYISGEDENSVKMDQLTWLDQRVAESISKCCIFLHLIGGSADASQFSAIYPQRSTPSLSAIGLNGVMLWHYEGYITAENLIEYIDKAWAALHMQETALTLLTAALTSKGPEPLNSNPNAVPSEQVVSSNSNVPSTSANNSTQDSEPRPLTNSQQLVEERLSESNSQKDNPLAEETCSQVEDVVKSRSIDDSSSSCSIGIEADSVLKDVNSATCNLGPNSNILVENAIVDKSKITTSSESDRRKTVRGPVPSQETTEVKEEITQVEKVDRSSDPSNAVKSNDVHLNIRMPNGTSLRTKLTLPDTLRSVKIFVDENLSTEIGSYDLAVPYPRKLFNDEDMTRTLSELGFASREALVIVPHRQVSGPPPRGKSSANDNQISVTRTESSEGTGGYFEYLKRVLSYVNPFSYLGGNTSPSNSETTNDGLWQYGLNPAIRNHQSGSGAPQRLSSPNNQNTASSSSGGSTRPRPSRQFGSNIHTLRHDDDDPSGDRNIFWNGNSTQFGGDDNKK